MRNTSTAVKRVQHDEDRNAMEVLFQSGELYLYSDVKLSLAVDLAWSDHPGKFFHRWIRGKFKYTRVGQVATNRELAL